jgi:tetratricopeptide (TPR) repeat protein
MRYVDALLRWGFAAAIGASLFAGLPACSSLGGHGGQGGQGGQPASDARPGAGATTAAAQAADAAPVDPAAQRAFESARRALIGGRTDEAERGFLALTRSNPELGGPHANLGVIYRAAGKYPESVAELELAVRADPRQPVYLNQLGISYRMLGQFGPARDAYQKAIALDPNYAVAYLNLGILYDLYFWESKRALELYDRYLALSPNGDDKVAKWVADLRNRGAQQNKLSRKEQP